MLQKADGSNEQQPQQHPLDRVSAQRHAAVLEKRHRLGLQHDDAVLEQKRPDRRHLEGHRPVDLKIARPFQNDRNVIVLVLHTRNLILVERRDERVLVDSRTDRRDSASPPRSERCKPE